MILGVDEGLTFDSSVSQHKLLSLPTHSPLVRAVPSIAGRMAAGSPGARAVVWVRSIPHTAKDAKQVVGVDRLHGV